MTAEDIVTKQHALYNKRDLDPYCALWANDAQLVDIPTGKILADGIDAVRAHYKKRFTNSPDLHCTVVKRIVQGDWVIDHEAVDGIQDQTLMVIAAYRVENGLISYLGFMS